MTFTAFLDAFPRYCTSGIDLHEHRPGGPCDCLTGGAR